jgi:hypothetical protein
LNFRRIDGTITAFLQKLEWDKSEACGAVVGYNGGGDEDARAKEPKGRWE